MAKEKEDVFANLQVVKRNGKKVDFNKTKIAIAIKKGFDDVIESTMDEDTGVAKYSEKDMQKIFQDVLSRIEKEWIGTYTPDNDAVGKESTVDVAKELVGKYRANF